MGYGSITAKRSLGRQLKALREKAGKSIDDLRIIGSRDKIWRMETGKGPYKFADVHSWAIVCGADPAAVIRLTELAAKTTGDSILEDYSDVLPSWFSTYYELEAAASKISIYEIDLMPGLFQTSDYARAVFAAGRQATPAEGIERQVTVRRERQQVIFERDTPVRIDAVLGEGALQRLVGGPDVMERQMEHLSLLVATYDVHIKVLTWQAGAHAAMEGAFTLLDFDNPEDPQVTYLETYAGARYLERSAKVSEYGEIFQLIQQQAIPLEEYVA